jgi:hypothetical protein
MSSAESKWFAAVATIEHCVLCGTYGIQVAHSNQDRGKSQKADAWLTAALCPTCHHEIDNGKVLSQLERRGMMDRAIVLTFSKLVESGLLVLGKVPKRPTTGAA